MEYMTKAKIQPWHKKFLGWIANIRKDVCKEGITFDCRLVGSAKRHLVIPHHYKGFDLDLRKRYYEKKTEKTDDKKSFQLLHEAVNETLKEFGV